MEWFRWYHGAISDPKWALVARRSKQTVGVVVAVWAALLEHASQNDERGSIEGFDCESIDAHFGFSDGATEAVCNAMKRNVTQCNTATVTNCYTIENSKIVGWNKRQPKREDDSSARVRAHREKEKHVKSQQVSENVTQCNAGVTQCNARTEQNRAEQSREEEDLTSRRQTPHPDGFYSPFSIFHPDGEMKISVADFERWKEAYPLIDVGAELQALSDWSRDAREWPKKSAFHACSSALRNKNAEARKLHSAEAKRDAAEQERYLAEKLRRGQPRN